MILSASITVRILGKTAKWKSPKRCNPVKKKRERKLKVVDKKGMVVNKISAVTKMDFQWNYKQRSSEIIETVFLTDSRDIVIKSHLKTFF